MNVSLPQRGLAESVLAQASWLDITVPELQAGALLKCSEYLDPVFTHKQWGF